MKSSGPGPKRHFAWMAQSRERGAKTFALSYNSALIPQAECLDTSPTYSPLFTQNA